LFLSDDLTVTNVKRIQLAIEKNACDCLLLKVNQIGSITEAIAAYDFLFFENFNRFLFIFRLDATWLVVPAGVLWLAIEVVKPKIHSLLILSLA
jgi:hypothetical protein